MKFTCVFNWVVIVFCRMSYLAWDDQLLTTVEVSGAGKMLIRSNDIWVLATRKFQQLTFYVAK